MSEFIGFGECSSCKRQTFVYNFESARNVCHECESNESLELKKLKEKVHAKFIKCIQSMYFDNVDPYSPEGEKRMRDELIEDSFKWVYLSMKESALKDKRR